MLTAAGEDCRTGAAAEIPPASTMARKSAKSEVASNRLSFCSCERPKKQVKESSPPSPSCNCKYHFLYLCLGEIFDLFQLNVRDVGQFIGRNHAVDNCRAL
jgi:hypothetical protein